MLEKNLKKMYFDAHFHYADCLKKGAIDCPETLYGCCSAGAVKEWEQVIERVREADCSKRENRELYFSFGIHPWYCMNEDSEENLLFLENLLSEKEISCVGEIGFDLFTPELKESEKMQIDFFIKQMELAESYQVPVVIHCRKAIHLLFEYKSLLKKVPAILLHSFSGTKMEAESLLANGINCFFSFGKQLINNNKKACECFSHLPINTLLCETDAPFQFLKGESLTTTSHIESVYKKGYELRSSEFDSFDEFCKKIELNARCLF